MSLEHYLFATYCLLGPTSWFTYALGLHTGLRRLTLLDLIPPFPTDTESVLAIIPAHNEEQTLHTCLTSVLSQQGCRLELLVINDRSTDRTPEILSNLQPHHPNLHTLTLTTPPPPNQTGKCAALIAGTTAALGTGNGSSLNPPPAAGSALSTGTPKWLLFLDADVILHPGAIASALRLALKGKLGERKAGHDLVSLLPRQLCITPAEKATVPLLAAAVTALWGLPYTNSDRLKSHAFACGQFLLIRADLYHELGGHRKVAHEFAEDVELARLAKRFGAHPRVANAPQYATVHQRPFASGLLHQWSRNLYGMKFLRPLPLVLGLLFPFLSILPLPLAAAWTAHRFLTPPFILSESLGWLTATLFHTALLLYCLRATYAAQSLPGSTLLLLPQGLLLYLRTFLKALRLTFTKTISWRPPN